MINKKILGANIHEFAYFILIYVFKIQSLKYVQCKNSKKLFILHENPFAVVKSNFTAFYVCAGCENTNKLKILESSLCFMSTQRERTKLEVKNKSCEVKQNSLYFFKINTLLFKIFPIFFQR